MEDKKRKKEDKKKKESTQKVGQVFYCQFQGHSFVYVELYKHQPVLKDCALLDTSVILLVLAPLPPP